MRAFRIADRREINLMAFSIFTSFFSRGFFFLFKLQQRVFMHIQSMPEFALRSFFFTMWNLIFILSFVIGVAYMTCVHVHISHYVYLCFFLFRFISHRSPRFLFVLFSFESEFVAYKYFLQREIKTKKNGQIPQWHCYMFRLAIGKTIFALQK